MRFSVDAHAIGQHLTGNETYIRNLLNGFAAHDDESDFIAYVSGENVDGDLPQRFLTRRVARNPWKRLGLDLPRHLLRDRPALLHVQYTAPVMCRVPIVVSVHDVSFLESPEYFTPFRSMQLRHTVQHTVRSAARVLTVSDFSKRSIMRAYGLEEERITVVPNGVSSAFRPVARESAAHWVSSRYPVPPRFILTVGDLQPRKNHIALIAAFEELIRAHPDLPQHLVLVGKPAWRSEEVIAAAKASPVGSRVHFMDFVCDEDLTRFYGACDLFVYPSLYEGFGLPIIEAMASGRAVACSSTTAMPEVADSAALLFDPTSRVEMVRAMRDLLLDAELRARMERLGVQRASIYNWDRTARQTLDVYYQVAGAAKRVPVRSSIPA